MSQDRSDISDAYDYFLEYEFDQPDSAYQELSSGLSNALELGDPDLIALGYKYLSWHYQDFEDNQNALRCIDSCIHYSTISNDKTQLINAYNQKGNLLSDIALLDTSLYWYEKGLILAKEINDQEGVAKIYNNMALVYVDQGDYLSAINFYHESIKVSESIKDLQSVADAYNNLGSLFTQIEDFEQAMSYHQKAYEIRKLEDDPMKMSSVILNIGRIYLAQDNCDSARSYFFQSLKFDKSIDDLDGVALNYNNIGLTHFLQNHLDSALFYYEASLAIRIEIEDPFGMALSYNNIGEYYNKMRKPDRAVENCSKSYQITTEKNLPYERLYACQCLYQAYEQKNELNTAYKYLKESVELEELLNSESDNKELTKNEMQFVFHYQALEDSLKQAEVIHSAELEKDKLAAEKRSQLYMFFIVGFFLVLIGVLIYVQLRKQKTKNQLIKEQHTFIQEQKHEIDQSISYAQKIQDTALPSKNLFNLFGDSFLLYLPRDVVSGDFYWLEDDDRYVHFAVADCTGHGIPGAFISMMGTILLNEIYNSKKLSEPGEILDELNRLVQLTLMSRTGEQMKDGMDISFCRFDKHTHILEYAGANNPVWIISDSTELYINGESSSPGITAVSKHLYEIKAQKQPIGKYADTGRSFQTQRIQLKKGDMVYLFSDGYADQFGGKQGKKFKYKQLKELLLTVCEMPGTDQKNEVLKSFTDWKGNFDQIDDVCLMGVRV